MIEIQDGSSNLAKRNSGSLNKPKRPLTVGALEFALLKRFPREDAEDWDRTGLLVGDPAALVTGVAVALDATCKAIDNAVAAGANVLVTHHPVFLDPPTAFSPSYALAESSGVVVYHAIQAGVALMNFHTALDCSVEATRMFPRIMGLEFERLLRPLPGNADKGYAMQCTIAPADAPMRLAQLGARATSVFGCQPRVWGDFSERVETVVIANGGAGDFVEDCLAAHVDCLICGELRYHTALSASQAGLAVIELGHDVSELPLCAILAQAAVEVGVETEAVSIIDQSGNWAYPEATRV